MTSRMLERSHLEVGLAPVADAFSGTVYSDVVNLKDHNRVRFVAFWGVGATGTVTLTVEACDDVVPTNVSAVPYTSRTTVGGADPGAITERAAAGFTTTAGSAQIIECEIQAAALLASGYSYARLKSVEVVDSPILGGILIEMLEPRHAGATQLSSVT